MKAFGAAHAKTHFLSLLNEVEKKREQVVVTKNGRPVARVVPMPLQDSDPIFGFYQGKLDIHGEVVSSLYSDEEWEDFFDRSAAQLG